MHVEQGKKMADSCFYTVSSSSSNGSTTDAQGACSPNCISDTQAKSLEDHVEVHVQLCCNIISVRIYSVFSLFSCVFRFFLCVIVKNFLIIIGY